MHMTSCKFSKRNGSRYNRILRLAYVVLCVVSCVAFVVSLIRMMMFCPNETSIMLAAVTIITLVRMDVVVKNVQQR